MGIFHRCSKESDVWNSTENRDSRYLPGGETGDYGRLSERRRRRGAVECPYCGCMTEGGRCPQCGSNEADTDGMW